MVNHYIVEVVKPKVILSDNGTQFQSPLWKGTMQKHDVKARYSVIYCIVCSHCLYSDWNIQPSCASFEASLQSTAGPLEPSVPSNVHIGRGSQFGGKERA